MNIYDLCVIIIAISIILCALPVYSLIRKKFNDINTSFDLTTENPDNYEQSLFDMEIDGVEYWINNSKGFWGESQENKKSGSK